MTEPKLPTWARVPKAMFPTLSLTARRVLAAAFYLYAVQVKRDQKSEISEQQMFEGVLELYGKPPLSFGWFLRNIN